MSFSESASLNFLKLAAPAMRSCSCLVAHFTRVHINLRRRWAIRRIEACLADSNLQLYADYQARLKILEQLKFLDSSVGDYCLTLKGIINLSLLLYQYYGLLEGHIILAYILINL
ncbi:unnamed protein product [Protopolystoma xenopodis]|uniref:Uncharacterized protein n=1 Tax=Protopolystoma xenopodis TaxID=117903 RepID=A0A3S5A1T8_9PLAT|nr:unnamed protein product [Protopolystoma xenopodis]